MLNVLLLSTGSSIVLVFECHNLHQKKSEDVDEWVVGGYYDGHLYDDEAAYGDTSEITRVQRIGNSLFVCYYVGPSALAVWWSGQYWSSMSDHK